MPSPGGPCPLKKKSTPARRLMAALNKLSARNYCKVTRDIADIMSEPASSDSAQEGGGADGGGAEVEGAGEAVDAVLGKSATDGCYTEVYARMLLDVLAELSGGGGMPAKAAAARRHLVAHVRACVPQDGSALAASALALSRIPTGSAAEYDDLCAAVKAKKQFLGRVSTALAVVALDSQRGADDDDMPGTGCAADSVCGAFETTVEEYAASLPPPSDPALPLAATTTAIEVMLEVVKLLVRACPSAKPSALARVGAALTPRLMETFGSKCRFLATDVLGVDTHAPQQPRQPRQPQQQGRQAAGQRVAQRQREPAAAAGGPQRRPQQAQGQGQAQQGYQGPHGHGHGQQPNGQDPRADKAAGGWHSRRG